jgi:Flp pilus assembly protein TadG
VYSLTLPSSGRRRFGHSQRRGALTVEFALTIPILLLFIFAMLEYMRAYMVKHALNEASYEACRVGVAPGALVSDVTAKANWMLTTLRIQNATVTVTPDAIDDSTTEVTVTIRCQYADNSWLTPIYLKGVSFQATTTLQHENALFNSQAP